MVHEEKPKKDEGRNTALPKVGKRIDLGKGLSENDARHAPPWLPRAAVSVIGFVFLSIFLWHIWGSIKGIVCDLIICLFLSLAMEPGVRWLIRHGWKRSVAALCVWLSVILAAAGLLWIFGQMFLNQMADLISSIPKLYNDVREYVDARTSAKMPQIGNLSSFILSRVQASWIGNFASTAANVAETVSYFAISFMIILFVTYYILAAGPKMQRCICSCLKPGEQKTFLIVWTVVQNQVSSFLSSRIILAAISSVCMAAYMLIMRVPYWLPLCLIYAVISQFIPMVGAFVGALLPLVIVWGNQGFKWALFMALYIFIYQQIENMILAPKIQQKTMSVHPAVGLLAVFIFGEAFGLLGSFLALPVTASLEVVFNAFFMRTELVDSPLLNDPQPGKRGKIAKWLSSVSKKLSPISSRIPRSAKGSTKRASSIRDQLEEADQAYKGYKSGSDLDSNETIAIAKEQMAKNGMEDSGKVKPDSPRIRWKDKE